MPKLNTSDGSMPAIPLTARPGVLSLTISDRFMPLRAAAGRRTRLLEFGPPEVHATVSEQ
jgi:hypothetical protein